MNTHSYVGPRYGLVVVLLFALLFSGAGAFAQGSGSCTEMCNWYSTLYPVCQHQSSGWGWENNQSCIGRTTCGQQWGDGGVLDVCDYGEEDLQLCESLNGRVYYSDGLYEMGLSPTGEIKGHRSVAFNDGQLLAMQSDYGIAGQYRCESGQVLATLTESEFTLSFADDYNSLNLDVFGGDNPVAYSLGGTPGSECSQVANRNYGSADDYLHFGSQPAVDMQITEGGVKVHYSSGFYDCATGPLHLHRTAGDAEPIIAELENGGAQVVAYLDGGMPWRFDSECSAGGGAVCGVRSEDIVCITGPCPPDFYQTYASRCAADEAGTPVLFEGGCGDRDGEPYWGHTEACGADAPYEPLCAAKTSIDRCTESPCPMQFYQNYSNRCEMKQDDARIAHEGDCGVQTGARVWDLSKSPYICGTGYVPVCAKNETDSGGVRTYRYQSYGNICEALIAVAETTWDHQACGALEGVTAPSAPPVKMVAALPEPEKTVNVLSASVEGDVLTVNLAYSGCQQQHFALQVERGFGESSPVQAHWALVPMVHDLCQVAFTDTLVYDLLPLKSLYEEAYGTGEATIVLPGLVDYRINVAATPATLDVYHPATGTLGEELIIKLVSSHPTVDGSGRPSAEIVDPNGQPVNAGWGASLPGVGPPWVTQQWYYVTPAIPGVYQVNVVWEVAPELNQSSSFTVTGTVSADSCAATGVDLATVHAYPDFPNLDWMGRPYNANYGDLMSYDGKVYRAQWWTTSVPGSDGSWAFVCDLL